VREIVVSRGSTIKRFPNNFGRTFRIQNASYTMIDPKSFAHVYLYKIHKNAAIRSAFRIIYMYMRKPFLFFRSHRTCTICVRRDVRVKTAFQNKSGAIFGKLSFRDAGVMLMWFGIII